MQTKNEKNEQSQKPNDQSSLMFEAYLKIFDLKTGEIIVNKRA